MIYFYKLSSQLFMIVFDYTFVATHANNITNSNREKLTYKYFQSMKQFLKSNLMLS